MSENPEEAVPYLRAAIEKALEEQDDLEEGYQLHFYAFYLLAQFQDKAFFPKIMEFVSVPPEQISVARLCKEAEVSRMAFYSHYSIPEDCFQEIF